MLAGGPFSRESAVIRLALLAFVPLLSLGAQAASAEPPRIYGGVAVSAERIAFQFGGQIFEVPRTGGAAVRRSTAPDEHQYPLYSPDGTQLAFSRANALWVMPSGGGEARRLTWYPRLPAPRAWSPDGREILFVSSRDGDGNQRAFVVPAAGGPERMLGLNPVRFASYSPDGTRLAVVGWSAFLGGVDRRFYRGGFREPISILDPETGKGTPVAAGDVNQILPMWSGGTLYFVSDSLGAFNLAAYDTLTKRSQLVTRYRSHGIVFAAIGGGAVAFVRDGRIHLYDIASRAVTIPRISIPADTSELRPRSVTITPFVETVSVGPRGERLTIEARGDVFVTDASGGAARNLTQSPGVADRAPVMSPDGRQVAWFSDEGGEYALTVRAVDGASPARRIALGATPTFFRGISWSPDARRVAFSDQRLVLWIADVSAGRAMPVDSSRWIAQDLWQTSWSPDGRLLAYAKADPAGIRAVWLRDVDAGTATQLSRGGSDDIWPVFDPSGRWLYFASSSSSGIAPARDVWSLQSDMLARSLVSHGIMVSVLRAGDVYPMLPYGAGANTVPGLPSARVDAAGASRRIARVGAPTRFVQQLWMTPTGALVAQVAVHPTTTPFDASSSELLRIDPSAAGRPAVLARGLRGAELSVDGAVALLTVGNARRMRSTTLADSAMTPIALDSVQVSVEPRREWEQMYRESFRMMRDYFYDPAHHGADIAALERHYATYLPQLTRRTDLNDLLLYAFGEVSVSHLQVAGGDQPRGGAPAERIGVLGADFAVESNRYRFTRIVRSGPYHPTNGLLQAPLDQPGVDVRVGEYLIAIDSVQVMADRPMEAHLIGKAYRPTTLLVGPTPDGRGAREVRMLPTGGENGLRRADWAERNRAEVERRTNGRIAYVYIESWSMGGMEELWRVVHGSRGAQGLIIDQRHNGGGITMDAAVEMLSREPWYDYMYRYGDGFAVPQHLIAGPKILMTSESNFSAAETFALMFKERKVGTIVGRRTGGGGIGGALFYQRLVDGGRVVIPNRASHNSRLGTWDIENFGVTPDIDVPLTQEDAVAGRDPQLDRAIREALRQADASRTPARKRPPMPVHPRRDP